MTRVLIADDNPLSLRFLADALASLGCTCVEAADGLVAAELARGSRFDLLLLDARMPGLGGAETLDRIRGEAGPSLRATALATTADNHPDARMALLEAGFAEVLLKPIAIADLHDALGRHGLAPTSISDGPVFDDTRALAAAGGDAAVVAALRNLLTTELDALPAEFAAIGANAQALHERLHKLDASAGFCGVPALTRAITQLRASLAGPEIPTAATTEFLRVCASIRRRLG